MQSSRSSAVAHRDTPASRSASSWLATACALVPLVILLGGATALVPATSDEAKFERRVYSFEVLDEAGQPYVHPFLGGFNVPRPQLADIDGDQDLDLFVQEYSGEVMFFENVGSAEQAELVWRSDRYQDLDIGEWYLLVDVDDDGDLDLLGEERFSRIRYFRNDGSATEPRLALTREKLLDVDGEEMFSDRQNIPKLADLDCDGNLDLLVGRVEGIITRFEVARMDEGGIPVFRHVVDRFENIEIIGQNLQVNPQARQQDAGALTAAAASPRVENTRYKRRPSLERGTLHGANTMALEDIDNDGDLDLFWGDFFEAGLLLIENRGSCRTPSMRAEPESFPRNTPVVTSGYNAPAFSDLDGDGDLDLLVGVLGGAFNPNNSTIDNFLMLENRGAQRFTERSRRFVSQIDVGSDSYPAFTDVDGDGDLDLFLGNKIEPGDTKAGRLFFFENVGSASEPRLQERGAVEGFDTVYHHSPAFADLDADGDIDILLGTWDDELQYLVNRVDGNSGGAKWQWEVADPEIAKLSRGRNATPTLGDIDGDGDYDLFVGESSGEINFYRNVGSAQQPSFELVADKFEVGGEILDAGRRSVPALADIDGDGDLDLLVGSESEGVLLIRNVGSVTEPSFEMDGTLDIPMRPMTTPALVDIDGDGDLDLFSGGIAGGLTFHENTAGSRR